MDDVPEPMTKQERREANRRAWGRGGAGPVTATGIIDPIGNPHAPLPLERLSSHTRGIVPVDGEAVSRDDSAQVDRIRAQTLLGLEVTTHPSTPITMKDRIASLALAAKVSGLLVDRSESTLTVVVRGFGRPPPRIDAEGVTPAVVYVQSRESTPTPPTAPQTAPSHGYAVDGATGGADTR